MNVMLSEWSAFSAVPVLPATATPKSAKVVAAVPSVQTCRMPSRTISKFSCAISACRTTSGSAVSRVITRS